MSLEKRIKRHVIGPRHEFFAVTLPGFEPLCADELAAISETLVIKERLAGGVAFEGRLSDLYLAALHARLPVRLLMRIARFKATNFGQLERHVRDTPWELYLPPGIIPELHVAAHHSRLYHSGAIADHVLRAVSARWSTLGVATASSRTQALYVRLEDDRTTLSIDGCGDPLYQRGLKAHGARAPIRETTAAGILIAAGYQVDAPLIDPMCGSGTFSLEAALMAKAIPPGGFREFAFMAWPAFRSRQWDHMKKTAARHSRRLEQAMIWASDSDGGAVSKMKDCVRNNHLEDTITVSKDNFFDLPPQGGLERKGLIVLNPPYGRRIKATGDLETQYREIAAKLSTDFSGWRMALLAPNKSLANALGISLTHQPIQHGGLNLVLLTGQI